MKKDELWEHLNNLGQDSGFAEKLATCENTDTLVTILEAEGVHTSASELEEVLSVFVSNGSNSELSEDVLDNVSGGSFFSSLYAFYKAVINGNFSGGGGGGAGGGGGGGR